MTGFSLETLLERLHKNVWQRLEEARAAWDHSVAKGDASEKVWIDLFDRYLPKRYCVARAFACDSHGNFSEQLDVVIYDRQYSPLVFEMDDQIIIPAESIYAVFESKQNANAKHVKAAGKKAESVRKLKRTSLARPSANGLAPPKDLRDDDIIAGLLTFESDWSPPLGQPLLQALGKLNAQQRLDIGCVAAHGWFQRVDGDHVIHERDKGATAFLLELIAELQAKATVPMIDTRAYAKWLG